MKKRVLTLLFVSAMIIGTVTACGSAPAEAEFTEQIVTTAEDDTKVEETKENLTEVETTETPEVEEQADSVDEEKEEPEKTEELEDTEEVDEEEPEKTEELEDTEEVDEEVSERTITTMDYKGITILSYDPDNAYVAKIRKAVPSCTVYPGAFIGKTGEYSWVFYFEPDESDTTNYFAFEKLGEPALNLTTEQLQAWDDDEFARFQEYINGIDSGKYPVIDLDGDGQLMFFEAMIDAYFVCADSTPTKYSGLIEFNTKDGMESSVWWPVNN